MVGTSSHDDFTDFTRCGNGGPTENASDGAGREIAAPILRVCYVEDSMRKVVPKERQNCL